MLGSRLDLEGVKYVSLSFDGGTSNTKGNHLLAITVHHQQQQWVLRPQWSSDGHAWSGATAVKSIIEACNVYGVRLDNICHVMIDGARYNEVAVDALNFATSVGRISKECEDHDSDMEQDANRDSMRRR